MPSILKETPASFFNETLDIIENNAKIAFNKLSKVPGLKPIMPSGAMYMMVGVDQAGFSKKFDNDLEIVEAMVTEQSVFCLPGKIFNIPNFFRIVLTVPEQFMVEACDRMAEFCSTHYDAKLAKTTEEMLSLAMEDSSSALSNSSSSDEAEEDETEQERGQKFNLNSYTSAVFNSTMRKTSGPAARLA